MDVIGMMVMYHVQSCKLCYIARHHLPLQSIAAGLRKQFISGLVSRSFIDITQLGCPPLADISLPGISCTFVLHNQFIHVCSLPTTHSFAQLLNFHILVLQYAKCPSQPAYHWFFQMTWSLRRTFFFNEQETKYVSVYLKENLKPQVKIRTYSGHVVLNDLQGFILVTLKCNTSKNEMHELGD